MTSHRFNTVFLLLFLAARPALAETVVVNPDRNVLGYSLKHVPRNDISNQALNRPSLRRGQRGKGKPLSLCVNPLATALGFMAGGLFLQGGIAASIADAYAVSITPGLGFIASGPIRGINAGSGLALRWHPGGTAPVGLFFAPSVEVNYYALKEKGSGANSGALGTGIGGLVGYQWIRRSRFTIALTGGIQYLIPRRFEVGDSQYKLLPVMPRLVLDLGYTFGRVPARTVRYSAPQADQDGRQLKAECRVPAADCRAPSAKWSER